MSESMNAAAGGEAIVTGASVQEVQDGKIMAVLCYVFTIIAIIPFIQKNNSFSLYHAKQALTLLIAAIAGNIALAVLSFVLVLVKLQLVASLLLFAYGIGLLGLVILGIVNSATGKMKPLPVVGPIALKLFKSTAVR